MAYISDDEINDIRASANIVDIVGDYIPLTPKGKNYLCVCPFHDDHSPSMSVSSEKQIYKCFSCGATGNVFTFVQNYENVSFAEAVNIVATKIGKTLNATFASPTNYKYKTEYEIMDLTLKFYQNNLKTAFGDEAKKYLTSRGINDEAIKEFGIGLSLDKSDALYTLLSKKNYDIKKLEDIGLINISKNGVYDTFTKRITFPLWDKDGHVVGFSARVYRGEKDTSKYINSKETIIFKKGETLYNYHIAKEYAKREKCIIVVEGFMDAIRLSLNGVKNVVALQGTALTKDQIELLKKLRSKVILCLDNDNAGELATLNNGELISNANLDLSVIRLSGEKDPDEYILKNGIDAFLQNLKNPISFMDFKMNYLKKNKDLNNSVELAKYVNEVIDNLAKSDDEVLKDITLKKLSSEYDLSLDVLKDRLNKIEPTKIIKRKEEVVKPVKKKKDIYNVGATKILFLMMNDPVYIKIYMKKIGCFIDALHRNIANEIVYYYDKNKTINVADFITYISNKELCEEVMKIVNDCANDEVNVEIMNDYVVAVNKAMTCNKIKELKEKLKAELDVDKKLKLAEKIAELKKGSVE
ncbi:MAG: DNA primase [Bacilli bacterium]